MAAGKRRASQWGARILNLVVILSVILSSGAAAPAARAAVSGAPAASVEASTEPPARPQFERPNPLVSSHFGESTVQNGGMEGGSTHSLPPFVSGLAAPLLEETASLV
jgi:hypothetical protein